MADVEKYQQHRNGPLKQDAIDFLNGIRVSRGWSYKTLGEYLGISGPFTHAILHKPSNVTTVTAMVKVAEGIERLENNDLSVRATSTSPEGDALLDHHFNLRSDLAISVSLPVDLTDREAERLGLFIKSLAH